jgi:hypothetical protein
MEITMALALGKPAALVEAHDLWEAPGRGVERGCLIDGNGSRDLIVALGKRWIGTSPCFGICKALFDCLFPLPTRPKLLVEDMRLEEKLQPPLRIEACTGRLDL